MSVVHRARKSILPGSGVKFVLGDNTKRVWGNSQHFKCSSKDWEMSELHKLTYTPLTCLYCKLELTSSSKSVAPLVLGDPILFLLAHRPRVSRHVVCSWALLVHYLSTKADIQNLKDKRKSSTFKVTHRPVTQQTVCLKTKENPALFKVTNGPVTRQTV